MKKMLVVFAHGVPAESLGMRLLRNGSVRAVAVTFAEPWHGMLKVTLEEPLPCSAEFAYIPLGSIAAMIDVDPAMAGFIEST